MNAGRLRLAVLGDPLLYTLSPELHRAGCAAVGLSGTSEPLRVPPERLGEVLLELAGAGYRGANLTHPLKEAALGHLSRISDDARRARSVNTVTFESGGASGDSTDGDGFVDLMAELGRPVEGARFVLWGAGGAARSVALALGRRGGAVTVVARRPEAAAAACAEIPGARIVEWDSEAARAAVAGADVVVNGTPLGGDGGPCPVESLERGTLVVDMTYGRELGGWVRRARAAGLAACDGLGMLVHQARRSLSLWTGREVPLAPLAAAVGWPR